MKATVTVMLKQGVLDPQGAAVKSALGALGFDGGRGCAPGQGDRARPRARHDRSAGDRDVREAAGQHRDRKLPGGDRLMRAARLTGWRAALEIGTVPEPDCPRDGVVLEVLACGICRSDWHVWTGADPVALPHVPGHEYCGIVVAAGPRGARLARGRPGDRALHPRLRGAAAIAGPGTRPSVRRRFCRASTCDGAFAERVAVAHADANLTRLPEGNGPGPCGGPGLPRDDGVACADRCARP